LCPTRSELGTLKERLAAEKKDEQSWKDEYQEISGVCLWTRSFSNSHAITAVKSCSLVEFSSDADERHKTYLQEREELLKQSKVFGVFPLANTV